MGILTRLERGRPPARIAQRMYSGAKQSRLTEGWGTSNTSADGELVSSLASLRARSRQLVRDAPYAKRAKVIIQNNVVGAGIGMQAQVKTARGVLNKRVNDDIELAWEAWMLAANCHTGGCLHFADLERAAMGQVFEAGEVLIRKHYSKFGDSPVPFALELIEAERLADDYSVPGPTADGASVRMGVEADKYHRPVAYWLRQRHPGEARWSEGGSSERLERVPADQIIHLRIVDRWPQTRGEPWLHAVLRKLNDTDGYSEAEIVAARSAASYMGIIESPEDSQQNTGTTTATATGGSEMVMEPGEVKHLAPGEKFNSFAPNRPNSGAEPFLRFMLREIAAGAGTSYESLSRDYSQSNYSSSRLALIDDRDLWRTLQRWFIRSLRAPLHNEWLQQAVLSRAIAGIPVDQYALNPLKFNAVRFKPRGWSWIDPTKEVAAYKEAVLAGFTTVSDVIALTGSGRDIEDVLDERKQELELMEAAGLTFDTEFKEPPAPVVAPPPEPDEDKDKDEPASETDNAARIAQIVGAAIAEAVRSMKAPQALVNVSSPEINIPPAVVNLKAGDVHIAPPAGC
jgi:lambda family phage portal protein